MTQIGNTTDTGDTTNVDSEGDVLASVYVSGSTFTPNQIKVKFEELNGDSGTIYAAVYQSSGGVPTNKLFSGSTTYAGSFSGTKTISVTGVELSSGLSYWIAFYFYSDGSLDIDVNTDEDATQHLKTWYENTPNGWTNNPSISNWSLTEEAVAYADDLGTTTSTSTSTTTSTSTSTTSTSTSTTTTSTSTTTTSTSTTSTSTTTTSTSTTTTSTSTTTLPGTTSTSTSSTSTSSTSTSSTSTSSTSTSTSTTTSTTSTSSSTSTSTSSSTSTSTTTTLLGPQLYVSDHYSAIIL